MERRLLTKKEKMVVNSRVYDYLYRKELGKLYREANKWLSDRGIKEYDIESGNGFDYHINSCEEPNFDKEVGNTRVRKQNVTLISIVRTYSGRTSYSTQGVKNFYLGNTDHIFEDSLKILESRGWKDLIDEEYFA